jgi:hypothetical protein
MYEKSKQNRLLQGREDENSSVIDNNVSFGSVSKSDCFVVLVPFSLYNQSKSSEFLLKFTALLALTSKFLVIFVCAFSGVWSPS